MLTDSIQQQPFVADALEPFVVPPDLRSVMRRWPTGVSVVTTAAGSRRAGMVMNSFASVSLDPALVSWCVDKASSSFETWMATDNFSIHVLGKDLGHYVPRFAQRGNDKFEGLSSHVGSTGAPALPGVALRLDCRIWARYEGGDHMILVGQVDHITQPESFEPLLFQSLRKS